MSHLIPVPAEAAADHRRVIRWVSLDRQSHLLLEGATVSEARAELLEQCGDELQREQILAGSFELAEGA